MRILLDTNVVVSALLFGGAPRALLRSLCLPTFEIWTSRALLRELSATLNYAKLRNALEQTGFDVRALIQAYASQCFVVPESSLAVVIFDPDPRDAAVLAAAQGAKAGWLVTGDRHLLEMADPPCEIITIAQALRRVG